MYNAAFLLIPHYWTAAFVEELHLASHPRAVYQRHRRDRNYQLISFSPSLSAPPPVYTRPFEGASTLFKCSLIVREGQRAANAHRLPHTHLARTRRISGHQPRLEKDRGAGIYTRMGFSTRTSRVRCAL